MQATQDLTYFSTGNVSLQILSNGTDTGITLLLLSLRVVQNGYGIWVSLWVTVEPQNQPNVSLIKA
jgi:hypothetical protein